MVGRLLRDKQGKEKVKALHMLPFSPNQPTAPNLDNSLNDFFKAIAISLLMEDVFAPTSLQTNDDSAPTGQLSGATPSVSSNIFDDLELDENQRLDLFDKAQKALVNGAGGLVESQGTYSPEELKEQMPSIMKKWVEENKIEADEQQIEELAKKIYNQFAKRSLQMQGINVSNINWQMIESADPIEFTLRYVGKDTTLESLKELRRLISSYESESNSKTHELCQWIIENGKTPNMHSENVIEHSLGRFLSMKRQAKQGKFNLAWYDSDQKIIESYNFPVLFKVEDLEEKSNQMCHEVCQWIKENNKIPGGKNKQNKSQESKLGSWIGKNKQAKNNKNISMTWYQSNQDIADSYGYNNLFDIESLEEKSNTKTHDLCNWIVANNRIPIGKSDDTIESILNEFLSSRKKAYNKTSKGAWFDSDLDIVKSYGLSNIFETRDSETNANDKVIEICKWICDNNKMPTRMF
jgi:hypothetical protein